MKKIIVSHKRADRVTTYQHIADCIICVPKAQEDDYKAHNPGIEILTHPDDVIGISPKRQWILEQFEEVFMLDDDIIGTNRVWLPPKYEIDKLTPKDVSNWIDDLAYLAKEMKAPLFGFNKTGNHAGYHGTIPFEFNKYIPGACMGFIKGHGLHFPKWAEFVGEDYYASALNAYHNRKNLIDNRLAFAFDKTENNPGGVADFRTETRRKETYIFLKKHFGDAIQPKQKRNFKKSYMKYEKQLIIPY